MAQITRRFACALALTTTLVLGCSKGTDGSASATASALAPAKPAAPEGLMASAVIAAPDATWKKLRELAGGASAMLPASTGGLAVMLLDLPPTASVEIDGNVPILGVIAAESGASAGAPPRFVIGIHVKEGSRFVDLLTKGDKATFTAEVDKTSGVTRLVSRAAGSAGTVGVLDNYLLVGSAPADLIALGPYVARSLPSAPVPKEDILVEAPDSALAGPLRESLKSAWASFKPAPDAPPTLAGALLTADASFDKLLAALGDASSGRISLNLDATTVHLRGELDAKAGSGPAGKLLGELGSGDTKALLDLPAGTLLGALIHDTAAERATGAEQRADAILGQLEEKPDAKDRQAVIDAITALGAARGDWLTVGIGLSGQAPEASIRGAAADPEALTKALDRLVMLGDLASVKQALTSGAITMTRAKATVPNVGQVDRVRFTVDRAKKKGLPPSAPNAIDLLYAVDKGAFTVATGLDGQAAYLSATQTTTPRLGADPAVRAAIEALGGEVALAVYAEPVRIMSAMGGRDPSGVGSAPAVLAVGHAEKARQIWVRLDLPSVLVQQVITQSLFR